METNLIDAVHILEPHIGYGGKYTYCLLIVQTMCLTLESGEMDMIPYVYPDGRAYQFVNESMVEHATCKDCIDIYHNKKRLLIMDTLLEEIDGPATD